MAKYSKVLIDKIVELYASGDHTIENICVMVGINKSTFYDWKDEKADFSNALKKADRERLGSLQEMARSGLAKLLNGFDYEETQTEYISDANGKPKVKSKKVTNKFIPPNPTSVIFALKELDGENFNTPQKHDHNVKGDNVIFYLPDNGRGDSSTGDNS